MTTQRRNIARIRLGVEQPHCSVKVNQLGAETVDLAAVHFNFARDLCPHVAERIDRNRLFFW
jgi:hypothetical protein